MDLKADFWHGKVKTYLVSYKLIKFYAKPKKSADLANFSKIAVLLFWLKLAKSTNLVKENRNMVVCRKYFHAQ